MLHLPRSKLTGESPAVSNLSDTFTSEISTSLGMESYISLVLMPVNDERAKLDEGRTGPMQQERLRVSHTSSN